MRTRPLAHLNVIQLEDRYLPNSLLDVLGLAVLGPALSLFAEGNQAPTRRTGVDSFSERPPSDSERSLVAMRSIGEDNYTSLLRHSPASLLNAGATGGRSCTGSTIEGTLLNGGTLELGKSALDFQARLPSDAFFAQPLGLNATTPDSLGSFDSEAAEISAPTLGGAANTALASNSPLQLAEPGLQTDSALPSASAGFTAPSVAFFQPIVVGRAHGSPTALSTHAAADSPLSPAEGITLTVTSNVPVNADNENGSLIVNGFPGIPTSRDFSVAPINNGGMGDLELQPATLKILGLPLNGTWTKVITTNQGGGTIALWQDNQKNQAFTLPGGGQATVTFYIEGTHESAAVGDITLTFTYTVNGQQYRASSSITVTPVINSFTVTPGGGANGQNVVFFNGVDGQQGLRAHTPAGGVGATFDASLNDTNLGGNPVLIQNATSIVNGANGTTNGAIFAGFNPQNLLPNAGVMFPILDTTAAQAAAGNPEYPLTASTNQNNTATLQSSDSPATGGQTNSQAELAIDVQFNFELQLLWKYPSGIYYPLAYVKWQPNFYGTATGNNLNKGPVNTIQVLHGVTADIKPTPNNDTPGSENTNQIANNVLAWR